MLLKQKYSIALVAISLNLVPQIAQATRCGFGMDIEQTGGVSDSLNTVGESYNGTDICPQNPAAGCDFDPDDLTVRTHDIVVYKASYNILGTPADNITISADLPIGYVWDSLPGFCGSGTGSGTPSSITGDGISAASELVCNLGSELPGAAVDVLFNVRVLGDRQDGDTFSVSSSFSAIDAEGSEDCAASDDTDEIVVTAAPRLNLNKRNYSYFPYTYNGEKGVRIIYKYRIGTVDSPLSGNAAADPSLPLTWIDDVSGISPNAELISCEARRHGNGEPYRSLAFTPSGSEDRAVADSGVLTCTQPGGAGTDINMSLTGADTTLSHYPDKTVGGAAISATEKIAAVGRLFIFVPLQDVIDAPGGELDARNCMSGFDPVSTAGISNFGDLAESEHDNCTNMTIISGGFGWSKRFREAPNVYTPPTTASAVSAGDGLVSPGQTWATLLAFRNRGLYDRPDVSYCDVIDINSYQFEPLPGGTAFQISDVVTLRHNGYTGGVVVEYASGYVGAWPPANGVTNAVRNECNDPSVVWNPSFAAAGGSAAVTKVRIRFTDEVPSGVYVYSWLNHKALDNGNPNGHILENQATLFLTETPTGRNCGYNQGEYPGGHSGASCGDRLILTRELARIQKKTDDPGIVGIDDTISTGVTGSDIKFWLIPSVTAATTSPAPTTVTITDVLPQYLNYANASPPPTSVQLDTPSAGQTTLTWVMANFTPNTPIAPIELNTEVDLDAPPGLLSNNVCIESTSDASEERLRCDSRGVQISVPAGLRVKKSVDLNYIDHDGQVEYELIWRNNSAADITEMVTIDVLPYVGLYTGPTNEYSGSFQLIDPALNPGLPAGVSVEYTMSPSNTLRIDPTHPSNLPGGSTIWCPGTPSPAAPAGCPASFVPITGVRFTDVTVLPPYAPSRSVRFKMKTSGNLTGDVYHNRFGGKGKETTLPTFSNKAVTTVLGVAVGGTVFDDPENDGDFDTGAGVFASVPVELYEAGMIPGTDLPHASTTTDAAGNYIFDFLEPGDYFVFIPQTAFPADRISSFLGAAANLVGDDVDDDDDQVDDGELVNGIVGHTNGVRSADINLSEHGEPLTEVAPNIATIHADDRSNFTVDFGFTGLVAVGNRVWIDDGAGGGGINNGIMDGAEAPVDGVTVELYQASTGVTGTPFASTVTSGGGYYEFDRLRPGKYIVFIPGINFAAVGQLEGLRSSSGFAGDDGLNEDVDENGQDAKVSGGIASVEIDLRGGLEAYLEDQANYTGTLADENVDFTVDFGFVKPASVGSLVWDDSDGDGHQDPGEGGVPGVCVSLIDVGQDGVARTDDDRLIETQTTSDGSVDVDGDGTVDPVGYYYFHNVMPGDYYLDYGCLPPSSVWSPAGAAGDPAADSDVGSGGNTPTFNLRPGDNDSTQDAGLFNPTTPVSFSMIKVDGGRTSSEAVFRFNTSIEDGTIGFDLYARKQQRWVKLNRNLIEARAADNGGDGASYVERVYDAYATEFAITEIDSSGTETVHGPYKAGIRYGQQQIKANDNQRRRAKPVSNALYRRPSGEPVNRLWLLTREAGVHRVDYRSLVRAGLNLRDVAVSRIAIMHRGKPVARYIGGVDATFGPGGFIEFLAEDAGSLYARNNVYEVRLSAKRADPVATIDVRSGRPAIHARRSVRLAHDRHYSRLAPTDDPWYMDRILATSQSRSKKYRIKTDGLVEGGAVIEVGVWGATDDPLLKGDHTVEVLVNNRLVATRRFEGVAEVQIRGRIPSGVLSSDSNIVEIRLPNRHGAKFDLVYIDNVEIHYPAHLQLKAESLNFSGADAAYRIANMDSADTVVWSRGAGGLRRHQVVTKNGHGRLSSIRGRRDYVIATKAAIKSPVLARVNQPTPLETDAEYLVISHPAFETSDLDRLVLERQAEGYSTDIVDVSDIYATYSGGIIDPLAIKAYIADAATKRGTRFVLLVGDDTYDPFDRLKTGSRSWLPTLYTQTDPAVRWSPSDSSFADIDGDGIQDLAIGRFPVSSPAELESIVRKTLMYADTAIPGSIIMAADSTDDATLYSFKRDSEKLISTLGGGWSIRRAFLDEQSVVRARASVVKGINNGASLVNYMGHSDLNTWSFDGLLRGEDVRSLTNSAAPTIALQWGCWNSYFVEPIKPVLGMDMLLSRDGGAAAVLGSGSLIRAVSERELSRELFRQISQGKLTLGEAVLQSKQALASRYPNRMTDAQMSFGLLGDPAIRIPVPDDRLALENGVEVDGQFGSRFGDANHDGSLTASFEGGDEDVLLSLKGFDIDRANEVDVYLNGRRIGGLARSHDNALNRGDMFLIRADQQRAGRNVVEFRHRFPGTRWGITELKLKNDDQPRVPLRVSKRDFNRYGNRYGSNKHPASLKADFTGSGRDLQLIVSGYDIGEKEVGVYLNGKLLDYLRAGKPDSLQRGNRMFIPAAQQLAENVIEFRPAQAGRTWGVTEMLLKDVSGTPVRLQLGKQDDGRYGHGFGPDDYPVSLVASWLGTIPRLSLQLQGFDIGKREISVYLNGRFIQFLKPTGAGRLQQLPAVPLPSRYQAVGENVVEFRVTRFNSPWGVTALKLKSGEYERANFDVLVEDRIRLQDIQGYIEEGG